MKKRKGEHDQAINADDQGREHVANLVRQENEAIRSFFQTPAVSVQAKKKKKKKTETIQIHGSLQQQQQLAVPADEPTPFVKQMEESGAGHVINPKTGKVKKVTKGKNATKGRGIVTDQIVPTRPLPKNSLSTNNTCPVPQNDEESDHKPREKRKRKESRVVEADADEDNEDKEYEEEDHVKVSDGKDEDYEDDPVMAALLSQREKEGLTNAMREFSYNEKGYVEAKPVYNNDMWMESAIRRLKKPPVVKTPAGQECPTFYIRRDQPPREFLVREEIKSTNVTISKLAITTTIEGDGETTAVSEPSMATVTEVVETWAKVMSFNSDGTFLWPESSKYLCWNCCHSFTGPPAMIPLGFNRAYGYYLTYGNFCTWSCAKRYSNDHDLDDQESTPSLDLFAYKYFGAKLPIPMPPKPILLDSFSEFGFSIEDYRKSGEVKFRTTENYEIIQPPCVPYEVLVTWQKNRPEKVKIKTGYEKDKKRLFEERMVGSRPMPDMPKGIAENTTTISDVVPGKLVPSKKQRKKNLLSLLE